MILIFPCSARAREETVFRGWQSLWHYYLFSFKNDVNCDLRLNILDLPELCSLPPISPPYKSSPCKALMYKWTFQNETCKEITYGGCLGTENLFEMEEECLATCGPKQENLK